MLSDVISGPEIAGQVSDPRPRAYENAKRKARHSPCHRGQVCHVKRAAAASLTAPSTPDNVFLIFTDRRRSLMKSIREIPQPAFSVSSQECRRSGLALLALLLLLFWPAASANAQSASAPPAQTPAPAQAAPQPGTSQTDTGNKPQSLGDAARAAKAQKDNSKAKRVYTGDDLAHIHGTISEVGSGTSTDSSPEGGNSGAYPEKMRRNPRARIRKRFGARRRV